MDWKSIYKSIYFRDGSLRDILILNTNSTDWRKWIDFINQNYIVEFVDRRTNEKNNKIDFAKVKEYWKKINQEGVYASIMIDGIKLMTYFNSENNIENDFWPNDINTIEDHNNLINYLIKVSILLNKPVRVTSEMNEEDILINVLNEKAQIMKPGKS